jgi:hypothetical protein
MAPHHFAYPKVTPVSTAAPATNAGGVKASGAQSSVR